MCAVVNQILLIKITLNSHLWEQVSVQYGKEHDEKNIRILKGTC